LLIGNSQDSAKNEQLKVVIIGAFRLRMPQKLIKAVSAMDWTLVDFWCPGVFVKSKTHPLALFDLFNLKLVM
jgi:hypothetical protein